MNEMSKIFALILMIDAVLKLIGSVLFATVFRATINYYPTFAFHVMCTITITVMAMICYVDVKTPYPFETVNDL